MFYTLIEHSEMVKEERRKKRRRINKRWRNLLLGVVGEKKRGKKKEERNVNQERAVGERVTLWDNTLIWLPRMWLNLQNYHLTHNSIVHF